MAGISQWKLRRLGARSVRVVGRHAATHAAIAAYQGSLVPLATNFSESYDGVKRFKTTWQREMAEGRGASAKLVKVMRAWLPRLAADIPQFDRSTFADTAVPDDIMEDASRMRETVEEFQDAAAADTNTLKPLSYAEQLLGELDPALAAAVKEWAEAEAADDNYKAALKQTRHLADDLHTELVKFRQTLLTVLGRSHTDYQKLRASRASASDPDDDPKAPTPADNAA
jgi:hypothetical protein